MPRAAAPQPIRFDDAISDLPFLSKRPMCQLAIFFVYVQFFWIYKEIIAFRINIPQLSFIGINYSLDNVSNSLV